MKCGLVRVNVSCMHSSIIDQNKRFLKMVRTTIMFNDGGV